jgi:hypothetical protein
MRVKKRLKRLLAAIVRALSAHPPCDPESPCWVEITHPYMLPW